MEVLISVLKLVWTIIYGVISLFFNFIVNFIKALPEFWPLYLFIILIVFFAFVINEAIYLIKSLPSIIRYLRSNYRKESGTSVFKIFYSRGYQGEFLAFEELERIPIYSKILANVYLPTDDGTTEVDLIYISVNGIFVIESKDYKGKIYGFDNQKDWFAYVGRRKYKFFNPVWQNKKHVKHLSLILNALRLQSVIVFSERSNISSIKFVNETENNVIYRRDLIDYIHAVGTDNSVTPEEVDSYYKILKTYTKKSKKEKKEHIERLKRNNN